MAYTRREVDQCDVIRKCQREVEDSYKAVSAGKPGAISRWNAANKALGSANQKLWNISAGLAFDDSDEG
jgi:hypothetical protein